MSWEMAADFWGYPNIFSSPPAKTCPRTFAPAPTSTGTRSLALSLYYLNSLAAYGMRIVMASGFGFWRAFLNPVPREVAAGFLRYPNHVLQCPRRDLSTDPRARSAVDDEIDPGQKIIAR
jgi:hypothetical protein